MAVILTHFQFDYLKKHLFVGNACGVLALLGQHTTRWLNFTHFHFLVFKILSLFVKNQNNFFVVRDRNFAFLSKRRHMINTVVN